MEDTCRSGDDSRGSTGAAHPRTLVIAPRLRSLFVCEPAIGPAQPTVASLTASLATLDEGRAAWQPPKCKPYAAAPASIQLAQHRGCAPPSPVAAVSLDMRCLARPCRGAGVQAVRSMSQPKQPGAQRRLPSRRCRLPPPLPPAWR